MLQNDCFVKTLVLTLFVFYSTNGFNFSPKPNLSLREPKLRVFQKRERSSYFGFAINLRKSSVFVGAPRAQSTLVLQRLINETGAIYNCTIADGTCKPSIFDSHGNIDAEYDGGDYLNSENKDYQWLGASIDGGPEDTDKLVVCAPKLAANYYDSNATLLNGICYWTPDTQKEILPTNIKRITPLRIRSKQRMITGIHNYIYGEQGLSVHVTANNEEIIIGAPGVYTWKGSVIRYHTNTNDNNMKDDYTSDVPNPKLWHQSNNSYFGYSVGSGYFNSDYPNKIYYVASAPQSNEQHAKVYIFDIIKNYSAEEEELSIYKFYSFSGSQFGEYFGYAVLAEDLNGDGLTDLIISAPQYSSNGHVDQGAIYVFINKRKFVFELQTIIKSPIEGTGRFGASITKLGDINRDGFNDIAVGAPFAGNGTVFIYLGGSKGLREVSAQQLHAGEVATPWGQYMFGHGLSKGCDIDNNGFNDFAIGAPNAEAVFLYRAYPVVKIHVKLNTSREIDLEQKTIKIEICYMISTESQKLQKQDIAIRVNADQSLQRVKFQQTNSSVLAFNASAEIYNQCRSFDANVTCSMAYVFKPIELLVHYDLINGIPNSEEFCDKCAAVDPADPKVAVEKITFTTGCSDVCISNLKIKSFGVSPTYILGSNKTISVSYEVENSGDRAYLPQINITSSNNMPFNKIPPSCHAKNNVLLCDLNRGQPMLTNIKDNITILYDASEIETSSINLTAAVFCTGNEQNPSDNVVSDIIILQEFTEIEVYSKNDTSYINLKDVYNSTEIVQIFEVKSRGPSKIQELEIALEIPIIAYRSFNGSTKPVSVIYVQNITVEAVYDGELLHADQNKTLLLANATENESRTQKYNNIATNPQGYKRRQNDQMALNNAFIQSPEAPKKAQEVLKDKVLELFPIKRTIFLNCSDPEMTVCKKSVLKVNNFIPDTIVNITLKYNVDLNEVNKTLIEQWKFFVIISKLSINKIGDLDGKTINITGNMQFIDVSISKHNDAVTPRWVIILAILGGLLVLAVIAYGLKRAGFFKRNRKEKMEMEMDQEVEEWKNGVLENAKDED